MTICISEFPPRVLKNIFKNGFEFVWHLSDEELEILDELEEERNEYSFDNLFEKSYDPCKYNPELVTLMNCAAVCKNWANVIIEEEFWNSIRKKKRPENYPQPWQLGRRWNELLSSVPVCIQCSFDKIPSTIEKIEISVIKKRKRFHVFFPFSTALQKNVYQAWKSLEPILRAKCTHLTIISRGETQDNREYRHQLGFGDLIFSKWPRLQSLEIDHCDTIVLTIKSLRDITEMFSKPEDDVKANPPFPALKKLSFPANPNSGMAKNVTLVAPHVEHCFMDTSGYPKDLGSDWDMHRNCLYHSYFLKCDKQYRTYFTPYCMHAFKWPGPRTLSSYRLSWSINSSVCHTPNYGVLISERRGKLCELRMSLEDFFKVEDLTRISIPERYEQ